MFLTNQAHAFPWEEPRSAPIKKNFAFYNNRDNLWNNPYLASNKVGVYYHIANSKFESRDTYKSPSQLLREDAKEEEDGRKEAIAAHRMLERERLSKRKIEREILQFASSQSLQAGAYNRVEETVGSNRQMLQEISKKRGCTFKDPSKRTVLTPNHNIAYDKLSSEEVGKLVRPLVLKRDGQAVKSIVQNLHCEKQSKDLYQEYMQEQRARLRQQLLNRHNAILLLQKQSGVRSFSRGPQLEETPKYNMQINEPREHQMESPPKRAYIGNQPTATGTNFQSNQPKRPGRTTRPAINQDDDENFPSVYEFMRPATTTFYRNESNRLMQLKQPKKQFEPPNFYDHSDFRGLILSDYAPALNNLPNLKMKKEGDLEEFSPSSPEKDLGQQLRRNQTNTRESFPISRVEPFIRGGTNSRLYGGLHTAAAMVGGRTQSTGMGYFGGLGAPAETAGGVELGTQEGSLVGGDAQDVRNLLNTFEERHINGKKLKMERGFPRVNMEEFMKDKTKANFSPELEAIIAKKERQKKRPGKRRAKQDIN